MFERVLNAILNVTYLPAVIFQKEILIKTTALKIHDKPGRYVLDEISFSIFSLRYGSLRKNCAHTQFFSGRYFPVLGLKI